MQQSQWHPMEMLLKTPPQLQYVKNIRKAICTQFFQLASTETPTFGPYNTIMCRPGTIFSYETTTSTGQGVIFAFDILIHSPATTIQNLVSVRNAASNYVSLTVYYDPADGLVKVKLQNPIWNEVAGSDLAVELGRLS